MLDADGCVAKYSGGRRSHRALGPGTWKEGDRRARGERGRDDEQPTARTVQSRLDRALGGSPPGGDRSDGFPAKIVALHNLALRGREPAEQSLDLVAIRESILGTSIGNDIQDVPRLRSSRLAFPAPAGDAVGNGAEPRPRRAPRLEGAGALQSPEQCLLDEIFGFGTDSPTGVGAQARQEPNEFGSEAIGHGFERKFTSHGLQYPWDVRWVARFRRNRLRG